MNKCIYDVCWKGICNKETISNTDFCEEHLGKKCQPNLRDNCDNQAVGDCHQYNGSFVCGSPLCEGHKHTH